MNKIIFIVADITAHGGVERVITFLSSSLSQRGYNVEILSLHRGSHHIIYPTSGVTVRFIDDHLYSGGKPRSMAVLWSHLKSSFKLNKQLMSQKEAFIIANSFPVAALMYPALFFSKNKYTVIEHVYHGYYPSFVQRIRKWIYKKFFRVICLTDSDTELFKKDGLKAITIPNALSFEAKQSTVRNVEKKQMIAVGRLEYQKGFDLLIEAFSQLDDQLKSTWTLDIYGIGSQKEALQNQITEAELTQQITLKGISETLDSQYAEYDVFVMSSRFEGFGMVILEAMSCGLPVIAFDCPTGPKDLLGDGEYGLLVNNINADALAVSLAQLMNDTQLRQTLSQKSLRRSQDYQMQNIIKYWDDLFRLTF